MKKKIFAVLATVAVAASLCAVSASADGLGKSDGESKPAPVETGDNATTASVAVFGVMGAAALATALAAGKMKKSEK